MTAPAPDPASAAPAPDLAPAAQPQPALQACDLAFSYRPSAPVLHDLSLQLQPGSFLAILGPNGSGKSTLLEAMDGLLQPSAGAVLISSAELSAPAPLAALELSQRARSIAFVAQHSHANRVIVYDALLLGRKPHLRTAPGPEDFAAVDEVIARLNLQDLALRYVDELSGGEYQKMIIARAFVQGAPILLLDEPTNNLDPANQAEVLQLIRHEVDSRQVAAAAVMHDINQALCYCDRFALMRDGSLLACGDASIISPDALQLTYGIRADIIYHKGRPVVVPL